ncbi:hypothetical protein [Photobacterium sp.]|uniref:hypothetical protein n=1 Tax=Photobacterium sp. TaxID=660 RepID=UPI00299E2FFD|nr:hypothetical protein [Photobacterium sp.]MDX1302904.1 hypothetical protein [Photobacterium sp.]
MENVKRARLLIALAEVVQDIEVVNAIEYSSGRLSNDELDGLEEIILKKVMAYRCHEKWPPKINPITEVMNFDS